MVSAVTPVSVSSVTRYLARQPILDLRGKVVAYELLFRDPGSAARNVSGETASQTMIDNMMVYGPGKLTAGVPAFINCTAETLLSEYVEMLPETLTVLEVLESVEVTDQVIEACGALQRKGYKLALDDFEYRRALDPLIRIADFIKVDFRMTPAAERRKLIRSLKDFKGAYLAEKVETREEFEEAKREGFSLFQGYYFCKPSVLRKGAVPSNRLVHLKLMQLMQEKPLNIGEIASLVEREPSLAYRLLRFTNSAAQGRRNEITSIRTALLVAGDDVFRRMATLAVAVELNSGPSPEILRLALQRARFCEVAAPFCGLNPTEQYLLGLFSLLDAMLQTPMEQALAQISVAGPIRAALLGVDNIHRCPLYWLESKERGDFSRCDELAISHGFDPQGLEENYHAATLWADELLAES